MAEREDDRPRFLGLGLAQWRQHLSEHKGRRLSDNEESGANSAYMAGAFCCFAALFGEVPAANLTITADANRIGHVIRELVEWRDLIKAGTEGARDGTD